MLSQKEKAEVLAEALDKDKVTLVCGIHNYVYGSKKPPVFKCARCMMVTFMGLLANTPASKRQETLEMLEYSTHKLVEADKRGELDAVKLRKHPKVYVNDKAIN